MGSSTEKKSRHINDLQSSTQTGFTGLKLGSSAKNQQDNKRKNNSDPAKAPEPVWTKPSETNDGEEQLSQKALLESNASESNTLDSEKIQFTALKESVEISTKDKSSNISLESELIRLKDFYERGLIDDQEYTKLKQKLLDI